MSYKVNIPKEALNAEGYFHKEDAKGLRRAGYVHLSELEVELFATQIARLLGVSEDRIYWFLRHKGIKNKLTMRDVLEIDWSELLDKDGRKRYRTYLKFPDNG